MTFANFISWAEREMKDWRTFKTLGDVKKQREGKPLRGKIFFAKYDAQRQVILQTIYNPESSSPNRLKKVQIQRIFERFMAASPTNKVTSSYDQIQIWKEAPDKIVTPAVAAVIWYWYDTNR
jgi:hypothetical protein